MPRSRALAALALVAAVATCSGPLLPRSLAGLHRARVWSGASAARLIGRMHGRTVAPRTSVVADYGGGGELRVFLSVYPSDEQAAKVLAAMLEEMGTGSTPFSPPRSEGDSGRWATFGPGGHHLLWVSHSHLYWVQGLPDAVQQAAAELPPPAAGTWT